MLYRVLKHLSTGQAFGDVVNGEGFKPDVLEKLLQANALQKISGPKLSTIQGWERRAELLKPLGITTAAKFAEADGEVIRRAWGHKTLRAVNKARREIMEILESKRLGG